jgi:hypothetical protein
MILVCRVFCKEKMGKLYRRTVGETVTTVITIGQVRIQIDSRDWSGWRIFGDLSALLLVVQENRTESCISEGKLF